MNDPATPPTPFADWDQLMVRTVGSQDLSGTWSLLSTVHLLSPGSISGTHGSPFTCIRNLAGPAQPLRPTCLPKRPQAWPTESHQTVSGNTVKTGLFMMNHITVTIFWLRDWPSPWEEKDVYWMCIVCSITSSFHFHNNPGTCVPLFRWGNQNSEMLRNLPTVTQLRNRKDKILIQVCLTPDLASLCYTHWRALF